MLLASTHQMHALHSCNYQKCFQTLPNVLWECGSKSQSQWVENHSHFQKIVRLWWTTGGIVSKGSVIRIRFPDHWGSSVDNFQTYPKRAFLMERERSTWMPVCQEVTFLSNLLVCFSNFPDCTLLEASTIHFPMHPMPSIWLILPQCELNYRISF